MHKDHSKEVPKVAIIGMACNFPQAPNLDAFWKLLLKGKSYWSSEYISNEKKLGTYRTRPTLIDPYLFDADFFSISPHFAEILDPQHRMALELCWQALEDAGIDPKKNKAKTGVFLSCNHNTYQHVNHWVSDRLNSKSVLPSQKFDILEANSNETLATRVAYHLNCKGPALSIQTACSSGLVCAHLAFNALHLGECDSALVGAVAIDCLNPTYYEFEEGMITSSKGVCRPFDSMADGTVFGDGGGVLVLKEYSQAVKDQDNIYAVIRGIAVNNDGNQKVHFNSPSVEGQVEVIKNALEISNLYPQDISYIEAHGTGTFLGDPIEIKALKEVYKKDLFENKSVKIGSVKGNIGHLDTASGIAGLIKVALSLYHNTLCLTPNFKEPNPHLELEKSPFEVLIKNEKGNSENQKMYIGISSLGVGGTNAHAILESFLLAPSINLSGTIDLPCCFSARNERDLKVFAQQLLNYLQLKYIKQEELTPILYTLLSSRSSHLYKCCFWVKDVNQLLEKLNLIALGKTNREIIQADEWQPEFQHIFPFEFQEKIQDWFVNNCTKKMESAFFNADTLYKAHLPTYPFNRKHFFIGGFQKEIKEAPSLFKDFKKSYSQSSKNFEEVEQQKMTLLLAEMFKECLNTSSIKPALHDAIDELHLNSIELISLTNYLKKKFGPLPKTIFYESVFFSDLFHVIKEEQPEAFYEFVEGKQKVGQTQNKYSFDLQSNHLNGSLEIAVVGISGQYPQSPNLEELWKSLVNKKNLIEEIPINRWDYKPYYSQDPHKRSIKSKWGGFLKNIDLFDPLFFNITPSEALLMDPQEKLMLLEVWRLFEDAGYDVKAFNESTLHKTGVFMGSMYSEYQLEGAVKTAQGNPIALNSVPSSIANRVSYFYDFKGPSFTLDTMCSTSLTALYFACQEIKESRIAAAIVGGVNLNLNVNKYIQLSHENLLSEEGLCRAFGKGGNGYVPSEGVGCVLLRPLKEAIKNGDHIYGVIESVSINHGGKSTSFTAPSVIAQKKLIESSFLQSGILPEQINYIEAHGTGTELGDAIEIRALSQTFNSKLANGPKIPIGSIKSNLGHCEATAALAGLTKILLQMKYRQLVPSIHSEVLNESLELEKSPFYVQHEVAPWVVESGVRRASLSSFGAGGSNAHMIIREGGVA